MTVCKLLNLFHLVLSGPGEVVVAGQIHLDVTEEHQALRIDSQQRLGGEVEADLLEVLGVEDGLGRDAVLLLSVLAATTTHII